MISSLVQIAGTCRAHGERAAEQRQSQNVVSDVATRAGHGLLALLSNSQGVDRIWQLTIKRYTNFTRFRKSREWQ
jgi:hypothetical protein